MAPAAAVVAGHTDRCRRRVVRRGDGMGLARRDRSVDRPVHAAELGTIGAVQCGTLAVAGPGRPVIRAVAALDLSGGPNARDRSPHPGVSSRSRRDGAPSADDLRRLVCRGHRLGRLRRPRRSGGRIGGGDRFVAGSGLSGYTAAAAVDADCRMRRRGGRHFSLPAGRCAVCRQRPL